jgi:hypothetical protein
MDVKCINGNCGYEFTHRNGKIVYATHNNDVMEEYGDILFEYVNGETRGLVKCPVCGKRCIERK